MSYYSGRVYGRTNWSPSKGRIFGMAHSTAPKLMNSQFASICKTCGGPIAIHTPILYKSGFGATHVDAAACEAAKAAAVAAPAVPSVVLDMTPVVAFLNVAKAKGLKFPKVRFTAPGGGELKLSIAGDTAAVPGSVNVVVRDEWLGRIEPNGTVSGRSKLTHKPLADNTELLALLSRIAADPATAAKEYGLLTGNCSLCTKALGFGADKRSLEVGYGSTCAKKYELPFPKASTKKTA